MWYYYQVDVTQLRMYYVAAFLCAQPAHVGYVQYCVSREYELLNQLTQIVSIFLLLAAEHCIILLA